MAEKIQVPDGQPVGTGKPGTGGKPPAGKPHTLKDEFKQKPGMVVGIGAAAVVVIYALIKRNAGAGTDAGDSSTGAAVDNPTPTYDSSDSDMYNSLEDQLGSLQTALTNLTSNPTGTTGTTGPTTGSTGTTTTSKSSGPPGPVHYETTRAGAQTLPEIEHLFGISQSQLLAYNPGFSATATSTFDPHNIKLGQIFVVPATAKQKKS